MSATPNFKFRRDPRFSVNQLADYMLTTTARQREAVVRSAKFPRTTAVVPYTASRRIITEFLPRNKGDLTVIDGQIDRLTLQHRRESDGWNRDELARNIEALTAFKAAFKKRKLAKHAFSAGAVDLTMNREGVRINTRLDAGIIETDDEGAAFGGGVVLFMAGSEAARKNLAERSKTVAAMVHWHLEEAGGNIEPLGRLCMSFDVFGSEITKAPTAIDRLRANVRSSCREAASQWSSVEPPAGYDGPDWR